jgi:diguanylate cyclase (GGDEF)-like protein
MASVPLAAGKKAGWRALLLFLVALPLCCGAPSALAAPMRALAFDNLGTFGADSQSIVTLMQDRQGFVWVGTGEGGLYRYDGLTPIKYINDPQNPRSLPSGRVSALYSDEHGTLWVGTAGGLARFDPLSNDFTAFAPSAGPNNFKVIRRIISDGQGGMWLATWGGLQHFDPQTGVFRIYQARAGDDDSLSHNDINALARDGKGGLWIGTWPAGLDYLPAGARKFEHFQVMLAGETDSDLNYVRALQVDRSGQLWIGTNAGVMVWQSGTPWHARHHVGQPSRINNILEDRAGDIWISTLSNGLWRWSRSDQQVTKYLHQGEDPNSLPSKDIDALLQDRTGMLWVGTFSDGISRTNPGIQGFERFLPRAIDPVAFDAGNFVRSLATAPEGRLWLGVEGGLVLFDLNRRSVLKKYLANPKLTGALSNSIIYSLYQAPGGPLWVGTASGLNRLDQIDGPFKVIRFDSRGSDFINTIAPGRDGTLWLGTGSSLIHYDPVSGRSVGYKHEPNNPYSRSVNGASAVLEDSAGRVWTGGFGAGGGLDVLDQSSGSFRHFRSDAQDPDSLNGDRVTCLFEDSRGNIWVGTTRGLNRLVPGADGSLRMQSFNRPGGPGTNIIEAIRGDKIGNIWISTVNGMSRYNVAAGTFTHFSIEDGLTAGFYMGSASASPDGTLYFGSTHGFTAINPAAPEPPTFPPVLAITNISVFNHSLSEGVQPKGVALEGSLANPGTLTLPWNAAVFSVEFAALHFDEPHRNRYEYRLDGFDADWIRTDAMHRIATYTNLFPGEYRLQVRAFNNKGLESAAPLVLPIRITPPFWQTWWFRTAAVLTLMLLLLATYRWRIRNLTRRATELELLVAERTSKLEVSNRKLAALSATDGLTGIANRRTFDAALAREWARATRRGEHLAVAMLDVDFFKLYNDHYGHQAGDDCLRTVAHIMASRVQRAGDVVARYGGEEFAFIAPATDGPSALRMAEEIRAEIEVLALQHVKSPLLQLTVSVGVAALKPVPDMRADTLLRAADQALYRAKKFGRNRALLAESEVAV